MPLSRSTGCFVIQRTLAAEATEPSHFPATEKPLQSCQRLMANLAIVIIMRFLPGINAGVSSAENFDENFAPMQLKESHAVVTGGASGLGLAVANRIVMAGGKVTLLDVNEAQGTAAAGALGDRAFFIATDVTDESAVNSAIDRARERMGSIN